MIDFIPMKLEPDTDPVPLEVGQIVMVEFEDFIKLPMRVVNVYNSGAFDGEVMWWES